MTARSVHDVLAAVASALTGSEPLGFQSVHNGPTQPCFAVADDEADHLTADAWLWSREGPNLIVLVRADASYDGTDQTHDQPGVSWRRKVAVHALVWGFHESHVDRLITALFQVLDDECTGAWYPERDERIARRGSGQTQGVARRVVFRLDASVPRTRVVSTLVDSAGVDANPAAQQGDGVLDGPEDQVFT